MSITALALAMLLYIVVGIDQLRKRDYAMAVVWLSYAMSQGAFIYLEWRKSCT